MDFDIDSIDSETKTIKMIFSHVGSLNIIETLMSKIERINFRFLLSLDTSNVKKTLNLSFKLKDEVKSPWKNSK